MYIIALCCWARTLKTRLKAPDPRRAELSSKGSASAGGGGGGGLIVFFFLAPPPHRPSELESARSSPAKALDPLARLHKRKRQDTKVLDCDPISAHPTRAILQVVSTNKANKARYGQRKDKGSICATHRKLGPVLCYFPYIYIYIYIFMYIYIYICAPCV